MISTWLGKFSRYTGAEPVLRLSAAPIQVQRLRWSITSFIAAEPPRAPFYNFPQNAKVTAPTRNANDTAWFHLISSPRYHHANTTNTHNVTTSWITLSWK